MRGLQSSTYWAVTVSLSALILAQAPFASADATQVARRLFDRLTGQPLSTSDPRLAQMASYIDHGNLMQAASIATSDDGFYNNTVRRWGASMSNRNEVALIQDEDPSWTSSHPAFGSLDDFTATIIGVVRDNLSAQLLLTGNFFYKVDSTLTNPNATTALGDPQADVTIMATNHHYTLAEEAGINLRQHLIQVPQRAYNTFLTNSSYNFQPSVPLTDAAGLLTTRAWGLAHLFQGTNRRAIQYAFQEFLCRPIGTWQDGFVPDDHVRRDVDRTPGGDVHVFKNFCVTCHAQLDGMAGAYARFTQYRPNTGALVGGSYLFYGLNFASANSSEYTQGFGGYTDSLIDTNNIQLKNNQNSVNYPYGHVVADDSWVNYTAINHSSSFGWNGPVSGNGIHAFGQMLAGSYAFPACMAQRVFGAVCKRPPASSETATIQQLANDFIGNGYNLRLLFEEAAVLPACLPAQ